MFFAGFDLLFSILFPILFLVVLGMILYAIIGNIRTWNKNNHSPRLTVPAAVVAKRTEVSRHHTDNTMMHTFTTYYVTFQVESGDRHPQFPRRHGAGAGSPRRCLPGEAVLRPDPQGH